MANPPPSFSLFYQKFLNGKNPTLSVDAEFLRSYTKVWLKSDESDKSWKVDLDGDKLAGGWEEFAAVNKFRDGDVLAFRHDGDENFHVSVSSNNTQHASSSYVNTVDAYIVDDDDDFDSTDDDDDDDGEDEDDVVYVDDEENIGNKKKKHEADSSSDNYGFITSRVTPYSLQKDRLDLPRDFSNLVSEKNKPREIDLVNEQGRRWTLRLAENSSSNVFYIRQGWSNFCYTNELSKGDLCKFKVMKNGEKPMLCLCPQHSENALEVEEEEEECPEADAMKNCYVGGSFNKEKKSMLNDEVSKGKKTKETHSRFLTIKYTPSRYRNGQLYISSEFARNNGITKSSEITLLNKDGRKWSSYLQVTGYGSSAKRWIYLRRGWREMCEANGVKVDDSFVLELLWENANPMFKFCSKIENKGKENQRSRKKRDCESTIQPRTVEKAPRIDIEGKAKRRVSFRPLDQECEKRGLTETSKQPNTQSRNLRRTQPKSCTVSDQVSNVRRGIADTLNTIKKFRSELKTREQNLEASLLEIDVLGERILGISKMFNNTFA